MYYDVQRKLAFVMPPRTGSTTFSGLLEQWEPNLIKLPRHTKLSEVQIDGFDQYAVYGFFRNPLDRFLSLIKHLQGRYIKYPMLMPFLNMTPDEFKSASYDELLDIFPSYENIFPIYFHPQHDWLADAKLLNYGEYDREVLRVARMFNVAKVKIDRNNWTEQTQNNLSQKVIDFVQSYYADDYRLGRERGLLA